MRKIHSKMMMKEKIENKLYSALDIELLEIHDESHLHAGHAGSNPQGESHFFVRIQAGNLKNLTRVQQHRLIYGILADELKERIHALRIEVID